MNKELKTKEKYKLVAREFERFYRAEREFIPYQEDMEILVLHDVMNDMDDEKYRKLINSRGSVEVKQEIFKILLATKTLSHEERLIVKFEFMTRGNPNWWNEYFSRSQYYRKRNETVNKIYRLLFE